MTSRRPSKSVMRTRRNLKTGGRLSKNCQSVSSFRLFIHLLNVCLFPVFIVRQTTLSYFSAMDALHLDILRCIAFGLGLDSEYFTPLCNENHQNLRLLRYPAVSHDDNITARNGVHTDYGSLTLLVQREIGGLQARTKQGKWVDVEPRKGAVIVNIGDMMMRWSNDILTSTPHRVGLDPKCESKVVPERYSIAFFCNPNKSAIIKALPNTHNEENPTKYAPISSRDYLTGRLKNSIKGVGERIDHQGAPRLRSSL